MVIQLTPNPTRQRYHVFPVGFPIDSDVRAHPDFYSVGDIPVNEILDIGQVGALAITITCIGPPVLREEAERPILPYISGNSRRSRLELALAQDVFACRREDQGRA